MIHIGKNIAFFCNNLSGNGFSVLSSIYYRQKSCFDIGKCMRKMHVIRKYHWQMQYRYILYWNMHSRNLKSFHPFFICFSTDISTSAHPYIITTSHKCVCFVINTTDTEFIDNTNNTQRLLVENHFCTNLIRTLKFDVRYYQMLTQTCYIFQKLTHDFHFKNLMNFWSNGYPSETLLS